MREEFIACGLNDREYEVLMHLLSAGPRSAGSIARSLNAKRPTIYSALEGLERQGLVISQKSASATVFSAAEPEELPRILVENAREKFSRVEGASELLKPRLARFSGRRSAQVGTFEITQIESTLDYLLLLKKFILSENYCSVWNPQAAIYSEKVQESIAGFLSITAKNQNHILDILVSGPQCDWYCKNIKNKNHQVRLIDEQPKDLADLIILKDSVIVSLNVPEQERAIRIGNREYADFMRWLFQALWERLK